MIYTSTNKLPKKEKGKEYFFLAGSIDYHLQSNWRQEIINKTGSSVHFFDPTRIDHNELSNFKMKEHIKWELDALDISDKIILNFLPNAKSPISLVELGMYVSTSKLIVICPNEFYQSRYIKVLCNKHKTSIFNTINEAVQYLSENYETYN